MTARLARIGLVAALGLAASAPTLFACGDKFLLPALGTHFERSRASRQAAAILIYAAPSSALAKSLAQLAVEPALRKEGYQPTIVSTTSAFNAAVRANRWDVVMVDSHDVPALPPSGPGTAPRILPVLNDATKDELKHARTTCGAAVDKPARARAFVDALDEAMDLHDADVRTAKKASR